MLCPFLPQLEHVTVFWHPVLLCPFWPQIEHVTVFWHPVLLCPFWPQIEHVTVFGQLVLLCPADPQIEQVIIIEWNTANNCFFFFGSELFQESRNLGVLKNFQFMTGDKWCRWSLFWFVWKVEFCFCNVHFSLNCMYCFGSTIGVSVFVLLVRWMMMNLTQNDVSRKKWFSRFNTLFFRKGLPSSDISNMYSY